MTYNHQNQYPALRRKRRAVKVIVIAAAVVLGMLLALVILGTVSGSDNSSGAPAHIPSPSPFPSTSTSAATNPAVKSKPSSVTIGGNDLVHVGEDVPAGTYRAAEKVDPGGDCYWKKTTDAEGEDIIANDIPAGGRPQVTLKAGQWFATEDCPIWVRK